MPTCSVAPVSSGLLLATAPISNEALVTQEADTGQQWGIDQRDGRQTAPNP
jgi:hypothetical protein